MAYVKTDADKIPAPSPARLGGGREWHDFAAHLRSDPGEWYELQDHGMSQNGAQVYASRIRNGKLKAFEPAGSYEARHGSGKLWARYVGN